MCGFVFVYAKDDRGLPATGTIDAMSAALRHRGPDEHGRGGAGPAIMAHRRLRVIDLEGGRQPFVSPDGKIWLVYNGEIYNFRELAVELRRCGHRLSGRSDTEVLMAAYREWGDDCVHRFNGMFAFALYDGLRGRVFAARDRFGEKPLYVADTESAVYLTSEIDSLLAGGVVAPEVDPATLYSYFTCKYGIGPRTILRGVRRLQPGHCLAVEDGVVRTWSYWTPPLPGNDVVDENETVRTVLDLLRDSVRLRLVADVSVGFFLSGGLDSGLIVALASELTDVPLETFGVGFEERRHDERPHQRFVAQRFGTKHHEILLKPESIDVIDDFVEHLDEPFADVAALPTWFLSRETRRHTVVALSGDGGDEIFAGYDVYKGYLASERVRRLPAFVRRAAAAALRRWPAGDAESQARRERLARNIDDASAPARARFVAKQQGAFRPSVLSAISPLLAPYCSHAHDRELFSPLFDERLDDLGAMAFWQQKTSLPDDMLFKVDRMSMAHSLEVRAPYLDHRLVELVNKVPFDIKLRGGRTKNLLKEAARGYFPADFIDRRKQGFTVPLASWFKEDLDGFARSRLLRRDAVVGRIVGRESMERMLTEHRRLDRNWSDAIWTLLVFETWCARRKLGPGIVDAASEFVVRLAMPADARGL
jgi:asparagine synthase (glutamine-hydrolysing)